MARKDSPADLVSKLKARGYSQKEIAAVLGVNDSYVSQVARGKKSGAAYEGALRQLWGAVRGRKTKAEPDKLAERVQRPERRRTKSGDVAKVRKAQTIRTAHGTVSIVGEAGAAGGARSLVAELRRAARKSWMSAFTVTIRRIREVDTGPNEYTRGAIHQSQGAGVRRSVTTLRTQCRLPAADMVTMVDEHEGNLTAALLTYLRESGQLSFDEEDLDIVSDAVIRIEMRTFSPR